MAKKTTVVEEKKLSRAQAEKLIARTTSPDELESKLFTGHPNKHVRAKAKNKLARLT